MFERGLKQHFGAPVESTQNQPMNLTTPTHAQQYAKNM